MVSLVSSSTKENSGRGFRKRLVCKVVIWIALLTAAYQLLWSYYLAGLNIPDFEIDKITGQKRIRRRPDKLTKRDHSAGLDVPTSPFDGILEGYLILVDIRIPKTGLLSDGDQKYSGVEARFCHISWQLQQQDPSKVPMFRDLQDQSTLCTSTMYSVDLWDVARKASDYDDRTHEFAATTPRPGQGAVKPTAVVFHQTRCGSTLIANVLAAFNPEKSRVYTESPPPVAALKACDYDRICDEGAQEALIQDVFYLMGRVHEHKAGKFVFYKIQSVGVQNINAFTRAMPDTPWIFAYRDSVEIMMSHFKNYQAGKELGANPQAVCLRNYKKPNQPALLSRLVSEKGRTLESLNPEEYCAAHLATLAESAVREYQLDPHSKTKRWFLNYKDLPFKVWEQILPALVGPVRESQINHMHHISKSYSKGRGPKAGMHFHEDSTVKQSRAPESVKAAVSLFLDPSFQTMEKLRKHIETRRGG